MIPRYVTIISLILCMSIGSLNASEDTTYSKGQLNIECTCGKNGKVKINWHHVVNIPKDNFVINLNEACKKTRNNYEDPKTFCEDNHDYLGKEYAFDPS